MVSSKNKEVHSSLSVENFIHIEDKDELFQFIEPSKKLGIKLLVLDSFTTEMLERFVNEKSRNQTLIKSLSSLLPQIQEFVTEEEKLKSALKLIRSSNTVFLSSRKTLESESINRLKNKLSDERTKYEIISIFVDNIDVAKWASHDRRVDYLTIDISNHRLIDEGLLSLAKQHEKTLELCLNALLEAKSSKQLSTVLRSARKITSRLLSKKNNFVLTIKPQTPYYLRTSLQIRYLGELIGIPFNKSKTATLYEPFRILLRNIAKLNGIYAFDGVEIIGE